MRKLAAVEEARAVMTEGLDWSAFRWLLERARVRAIADRATAALNRADKHAKAAWPDDLKIAYAAVAADEKRSRTNHNGEQSSTDPELRLVAKRIKDADDRAERCRLHAEAMFAEAEARFSAVMARGGARKALETYDLREAAIRKTEAAVRINEVLNSR